MKKLLLTTAILAFAGFQQPALAHGDEKHEGHHTEAPAADSKAAATTTDAQSALAEIQAGMKTISTQISENKHDAMHDEIEKRGINKSQIIILDALLKLRQVCCDPRLLKMEHTVTESAKLTMLTEMLEEMVEEGRKILIFSQFTGMLDLIAKENLFKSKNFFSATFFFISNKLSVCIIMRKTCFFLLWSTT